MEPICIEKGVSEFGCAAVSWGLYFGYFLMVATIVVLVVLPMKNALQAPKDMVKSALGFGVLIVVFLISYLLSGDEVSLKAASLGVGPGSSKLIGAGLTMFYFALLISIVGLIYSEVKKALL